MNFNNYFLLCMTIILMLSIAKAQNKNLSPTYNCCDDGSAEQAGLNDSTNVYDNDQNCLHEKTVSARECVDRTRDHSICNGQPGSKFCLQTRGVQYPRYYALWHPIIVSTHSMTFSRAKCAGNLSSQILSIQNGVWQAFQIDYTLNWSATKTQSWLTVSPSSGNVSDVEPELQTVSINTRRMIVTK